MSKGGRPSKLTSFQRKVVAGRYNSNPELSLSDMVDDVEERWGVEVSRSLIQRCIEKHPEIEESDIGGDE